MYDARRETPSLEEVQTFAQSEGLSGKTNVQRFYRYYEKQGFLYRGLPIDWKAKLREWSKTEYSKAKNFTTVAQHEKGKKSPFASREDFDKYWARLQKEMEGWGK